MHLFVAIAFFMPIVTVTSDLKEFGGGTQRYLIGISSALALGALIVLLEWELGKAVWFKCQRYSTHARKLVAMSHFALQLIWIMVGAVFGTKLAVFIAEHIAP